MKHRVLVVDDDPVMLLLLGKMVEKWGATVDKARNGDEATAMALATTYSVIIMDVHHSSKLSSLHERVLESVDDVSTEENCSGGGEGSIVTRRIRKNSMEMKHGKPPPIIGCTSDNSPRTRETCLEAGMMTVIYKPVNMERLISALDSAVL